MFLDDIGFGVKFMTGAIAHEHVYMAAFGSVLASMQNCLVSQRAAEAHSSRDPANGLVYDSKQQRSSSGCFRCSGIHRVKAWQQNILGNKSLTDKNSTETSLGGVASVAAALSTSLLAVLNSEHMMK